METVGIWGKMAKAVFEESRVGPFNSTDGSEGHFSM